MWLKMFKELNWKRLSLRKCLPYLNYKDTNRFRLSLENQKI